MALPALLRLLSNEERARAERFRSSRARTEFIVARAGLRKLVIVTSHGGNVDTMRVAARELRVNCQMLVVTTGWRFGVRFGW